MLTKTHPCLLRYFWIWQLLLVLNCAAFTVCTCHYFVYICASVGSWNNFPFKTRPNEKARANKQKATVILTVVTGQNFTIIIYHVSSGPTQVSVPEFIFKRVLCTDAGLSSSPWGPAAGQILGVPGPAGQVDRLLRRHWDKNGETRQSEWTEGQRERA